MSRQIVGVSDGSPSGRGRSVGQIFGGPITATTTPTDYSWIIACNDIENFSIQLVWGAKVSWTDNKIYTSNSYVPNEGNGGGQVEANALRAGNWVDTGTRYVPADFVAPTGSAAGQGELCSNGKNVDACYVKITLHGVVASSTTDTVNGYVSTKSFT
jgi:hypothetical protein